MPIRLSRRHLIAVAAGTLLSAPRLAKSATTRIAGAGSNFARPVVQRWIETMPPALGIEATYTIMGTGASQSKILSGEIDFATVELPLPVTTLADGDLLQFPVAFGALVCVANIPGIASNQLQLNANLLAAIYSGAIRKWNDPRIAAANPGLALPGMDILPLRLETPQNAVFSTTRTLQQYLLATNADWREKFGAAITRSWAIGSMVSTIGNMVETMQALPGSIGYMSVGDALSKNLAIVKLQNKAGKAVTANVASLQAAVAQVDWAKAPGLVANLLDLPGNDAWPIVLPSYALIRHTPAEPARGAATRAFLKHVLTEGAAAAAAAERHAATLPPAPSATALALLGKSAVTAAR